MTEEVLTLASARSPEYAIGLAAHGTRASTSAVAVSPLSPAALIEALIATLATELDPLSLDASRPTAIETAAEDESPSVAEIIPKP